LDRGSRGPSTVTLIALVYVATCGGVVDTVIVSVKLLPETESAIGMMRERSRTTSSVATHPHAFLLIRAVATRLFSPRSKVRKRG
jgi:hypothetical protein